MYTQRKYLVHYAVGLLTLPKSLLLSICPSQNSDRLVQRTGEDAIVLETTPMVNYCLWVNVSRNPGFVALCGRACCAVDTPLMFLVSHHLSAARPAWSSANRSPRPKLARATTRTLPTTRSLQQPRALRLATVHPNICLSAPVPVTQPPLLLTPTDSTGCRQGWRGWRRGERCRRDTRPVLGRRGAAAASHQQRGHSPAAHAVQSVSAVSR